MIDTSHSIRRTDDGPVDLVGVDVVARVDDGEPYCVWLAATSTGLSSGVALTGRDLGPDCQPEGDRRAVEVQEGFHGADTLMQQVPYGDGA